MLFIKYNKYKNCVCQCIILYLLIRHGQQDNSLKIVMEITPALDITVDKYLD